MRAALVVLLLACPVQAQGRFVTKWEGKLTQRWEAMRPAVEGLVNLVNRNYRLRDDVPIYFGYNNHPEINYCLSDRRAPKTSRSAIEVGYGYFPQAGPTAESAVVQYSLLRCMARALCFDLNLPTTGRQDDCDDQLACVILEEDGDAGVELLRAGLWYDFGQSFREHEAENLTSGRSLRLQRMRTLAECLDHLDAKKNSYAIARAGFEESQLAGMRTEYGSWSVAWKHLLRPYRRDLAAAPDPRDLVKLEPADEGLVTFEFRHSKGAYGEALRQRFEDPEYQQWKALARFLQEHFRLPRDLCIVFKDLNEDNAFYSPDTHRIIVGYELLEFIDSILAPTVAAPEARQQAVLQVAEEMLMHELGHALIAELGLDASGREEDAADQFAVLMLAQLPGGEEALQTAIHYRALRADHYHITDSMAELTSHATDEHSLDAQRLTTMQGMLLALHAKDTVRLFQGANPAALWNTYQDSYRLIWSWNRLLSPHLRKPLAAHPLQR